MKRVARLACTMLGLLGVFPLPAVLAAPAQDKPFAFAVIGHTFPDASGDNDLQRNIDRADHARVAFVIAAGIKSAGEPCSDKLYQQRRALLDKSERPLVLVLTGSDWTECRNSAGRSNALERLNRIREIYFDGREALGGSRSKALDLNRQSTITKFRSYAENTHWEMRGVLFGTLNVPSRNNHYLLEAGRNSEYEDRLVANRAWLQRLFGLAKRRGMAGIVLFTDGDVRAHVDQGFSLLSGFTSKQDGFAETRRLIRTLAEKYPGKVLLVDVNREPAVKGDPAPGTVSWRKNVGHVTLAGEWNMVRVAPGDDMPFALNAEDGEEERGRARPAAQ